MKSKAQDSRPAKLVLEDGSEYQGFLFGKARAQAGEVVFASNMTGYVEFLTDPSYRGQILVATYPLMGNGGVPVKPRTADPYFSEQGLPVHFESGAVQVAGFVVAQACEEPSHYSSGATISERLEKNNVPGIYGIDTRALALRLRSGGVMRGKILVEGSREVTIETSVSHDLVAEVSCKEITTYLPEGAKVKPVAKIALLDCGVKANIIRALLARNVEVIRLPWNNDLKDIEYDGLLLSNGPGDPKACAKIIATARKAFERKKPVFGIGLGLQIMALAAGADTYKLPFGHRAQAQPCLELGAGGVPTGRCYVTSQNHGFAVRAESLPKDWECWFRNANDNSIEGIRCTRHPFSAVQFSPEGSPGPRDTDFVFDNFLEQVRLFQAAAKTGGKK
jgi:carbamoyl-phosphate synthase small subunit